MAVATSIVTADAGVNDNMDSPLITVANWLGMGKEDSVPTDFDAATLVEKVNYLEDKLVEQQSTGSGSVKSIQRSVASGNQTVTLEHAVDPNKTIILLNGSCTEVNAYNSYAVNGICNGGYISSLTPNSFTVEGANMNGCYEGTYSKVTYSWQVIEFY